MVGPGGPADQRDPPMRKFFERKTGFGEGLVGGDHRHQSRGRTMAQTFAVHQGGLDALVGHSSDVAVEPVVDELLKTDDSAFARTKRRLVGSQIVADGRDHSPSGDEYPFHIFVPISTNFMSAH